MTIQSAAETIWEYMLLHHKLEKVDVIVVLGSNDTRVAEYAAALYHQGLAPLLVVTGDGTKHETKFLHNVYDGKTEAEVFTEIIVTHGVPKEHILIEDRANNTGQNFEYTKKVLEGHNIAIASAIIVTKPYMERRAYATGRIQWPEIKLLLTSPPITFRDYPNEFLPEEDIINIMLGDFERIAEYPKQGFQIEQEIPEAISDAFMYLKEHGYTKHLLS